MSASDLHQMETEVWLPNEPRAAKKGLSSCAVSQGRVAALGIVTCRVHGLVLMVKRGSQLKLWHAHEWRGGAHADMTRVSPSVTRLDFCGSASGILTQRRPSRNLCVVPGPQHPQPTRAYALYMQPAARGPCWRLARGAGGV